MFHWTKRNKTERNYIFRKKIVLTSLISVWFIMTLVSINSRSGVIIDMPDNNRGGILFQQFQLECHRDKLTLAFRIRLFLLKKLNELCHAQRCPRSICAQGRPWSGCSSTQSDQGLRCPQTELLDTIECSSGEQIREWDFAHVQNDANPHILLITKTRLFKYIENFTTKKGKFSDKKFWYFSYFCSKHRLWVFVRTTSARRF